MVMGLVRGFAFLGVMGVASCTTTTEQVTRGDTAFQTGTGGILSTSGSPQAALPAANLENRMTVYMTGYSFWDNTPRASAAISKPVIHRQAGGKGTYSDPVTLAVGHVIQGRRQTLDYPAGTRFYIERLRKYAIVEDVCGDGHNPQAGPCHAGHRGHPWIDIYVDGRRTGEDAATSCTYRVTAIQSVIINPRPDYPVEAGALTETGCRTF